MIVVTDEELTSVMDEYGMEQILFDANLTEKQVIMILHESGYIDLTIYDE